MLTTYLLRDRQSKNPGYVVFVTNAEEVVVSETVFSTQTYSDALSQAQALFLLISRQSPIGCYIENEYGNTLSVSFSETKFPITKSDGIYYQTLVDLYESYLVDHSPVSAYVRIVSEKNLTSEEAAVLKHLVDVEKTIFSYLNK